MCGTSVVHTKGNPEPSTQHGKNIKHVTAPSFVSASGEAAPPAVVATGTLHQPDWEKIWPEATFACNPKASVTGPLWVELTASTFVKHIRQVKKIEGWVLLIIDSGGEQGLHLSMEFTLLMYRNQIEVVALAEYFTKALMPLDRDPHREMKLGWSALRTDFAGKKQDTSWRPSSKLWR